jgi:phosphoglycolate phosphatase
VGHVHGRLVAFDLDGTLVDSRRDLSDSANDLIVELGGAPLTEDAIGRMVGEGAGVLVARALEAAGLGTVPGARERFLEIYDGRLLNFTRPYDGVVEAVRLAREYARVTVLTNKPLAPSLRILEALGLRDLFDDVAGGDTALGRKPEPAALQAMIGDAGATPATTAMGLNYEEILGSVRFSLGIQNTKQELDKTVEILSMVITELRERSPFKTKY